MSEERLEGPAADAFVAAAISLSRDAAVSTTWFELAVKGLEAAWSERPLLPAPTLTLDLTALLHGERLLPITPPAQESVRDALRGYEDHVLARLTSDRRWTRLTEAFAALPKDLHAAAAGLVTSQLLARLSLNGGTGVSSGVVRRFTSREPAEVIETGRAALYEPTVAARIADGFTLLARAARRTRELLSDAEVFLVENLAALKGLAARVALAQLAEVAQQVQETLPARLRGSVFEDGDAATQLEEDSAYPVGGFSSISTQGSLENLVSSELIYMEEGADPSLRPDLFDVRFVEGELLYYARDESVAVRRRRVLTLVFDASLVRTRVKDPGEAYQRVMWVMGAVTALVRKLSEWLDTEALTFELVFTGEGNDVSLDEEAGVLGLVLREYRERGQVEVRHAVHPLEVVREARQAHRQRGRVMLVAAKLPSGLEGDSAPDALIDVGQARPRVMWKDAASLQAEEAFPSALEAWGAATRGLLDGLLQKKSR